MAVSLDPATAGQLRIHLLGGLRVQVGDLTLPGEWRLRKSAHLVAMLALAPDYRLHREHLLDALWPDLEPVAASNNLAQAVLVARRAIDPAAGAARSCFKREGGTLALRPPGGLWVDVEAFVASAVAARQSQEPQLYWQAIDLYGGDLVPEEPYADWAASRREALRQTYVELLLALGQLQLLRGEPSQALTALQRLIATEPAHEAAHRLAMSTFQQLGQTDQAMRQYEALREALARDLDAEPDAVSQQLYEQVVADRHRVQETGGASEAIIALDLAAPPRSFEPTAGRWPPTNLPSPLTSFIGREQELAEVTRLLADTRLLTLTGGGGVGKTRLALAAAEVATSDYPDGVWLIELASLADPALLPNAVASALHVTEWPGRSALDTVRAALTTKRMLLVLDNCEHLVDACAGLVEALLAHCPTVTVLVASRERLGLVGEVLWRVPPLALPAADADVRVASAAAVRFFVARAAAVETSFALTEHNTAAVVRVCRQLDGIPLALELAAARLTAFTVEDIAARLDDRFLLLTSNHRTAQPRQRTLRATLDWSHDLLTVAEQVVFRRLSVFAGGFTVEAVEAVCAWGGNQRSKAEAVDELPGAARDTRSADLVLRPPRPGPPPVAHRTRPQLPPDVLDILARLVDQSLVQAGVGVSGASRFAMLQTVRQYGLERLVESGERQVICQRHAEWCTVLAERAEPELRLSSQLLWFERLEAEQDNGRAALTWCQERDPVLGLRLAAALGWYWCVRDQTAEGRRWLETFLALVADPTELRIQALHRAGLMSRHQGDHANELARYDEGLTLARKLVALPLLAWNLRAKAEGLMFYGQYESATTAMNESLAVSRQVGDRRGEGVSLVGLGWLVGRTGQDRDAGLAMLEEGLAILRAVGDRLAICNALEAVAGMCLEAGARARAQVLLEDLIVFARELGAEQWVVMGQTLMGQLAYDQGDLERAHEYQATSLAGALDQQDRAYVAWASVRLGLIALRRGAAAEATALAQEGAALFADLGMSHGCAYAGLVIGQIALSNGDLTDARASLHESLTTNHVVGERLGTTQGLEAFAMLAMAESHPALAARLIGAAETLRAALGAPLPPIDRRDHDATIWAARSAMGEKAYNAAHTVGAALTQDQAVAEALSPYPPAEPGHIEQANRDR